MAIEQLEALSRVEKIVFDHLNKGRTPRDIIKVIGEKVYSEAVVGIKQKWGIPEGTYYYSWVPYYLENGPQHFIDHFESLKCCFPNLEELMQNYLVNEYKYSKKLGKLEVHKFLLALYVVLNEGYKPEDIAEMIDVSLVQVRTYLSELKNVLKVEPNTKYWTWVEFFANQLTPAQNELWELYNYFRGQLSLTKAAEFCSSYSGRANVNKANKEIAKVMGFKTTNTSDWFQRTHESPAIIDLYAYMQRNPTANIEMTMDSAFYRQGEYYYPFASTNQFSIYLDLLAVFLEIEIPRSYQMKVRKKYQILQNEINLRMASHRES